MMSGCPDGFDMAVSITNDGSLISTCPLTGDWAIAMGEYPIGKIVMASTVKMTIQQNLARDVGKKPTLDPS
ncbi:MAG: hypothetical protein HPY90_01955 [Syntrophothermus sp.]|uniref:hypothetical protein n=1 Tax=Syntrophothermus sp. TaxID=2736299 RepID=UPI002579C820|nr:hypothetical protein [Syntrophothermus sp.]NSW82026.1 hypothetical protein [Syntrophothermus sp.]